MRIRSLVIKRYHNVKKCIKEEDHKYAAKPPRTFAACYMT